MSRKFLLLFIRVGISLVTLTLLLPTSAFAQSPWERAANNLALSFTGPLARALALVAIVIGGLMFMFGEGGAKRRERAYATTSRLFDASHSFRCQSTKRSRALARPRRFAPPPPLR